jgi:hypothetical protein
LTWMPCSLCTQSGMTVPRDGQRGHGALQGSRLAGSEVDELAQRLPHVPGRDFRLRLAFSETEEVIRVEVTDTRSEKLPAPNAPGVSPTAPPLKARQPFRPR